ncbi:hypothetical protein PO124_33500 [Bacillus licheniformis]|nr:hypothetical protein [Bacillus licheniformis]
MAQFVPARAGEGSEFLVSLARASFLPAPSVTIQVTYLTVNLISRIRAVCHCAVKQNTGSRNGTWLEVYQTTSPAPSGTTQAFI